MHDDRLQCTDRAYFASNSRITVGLALAGVAALFIGCGGDEPTEPNGGGGGGSAVVSVEVTPGSSTLEALGGTVDFEAVARDGDGNTVSEVDFDWSSSDGSVATVDGDGVAEAVGDGEAEITAAASEVSGSAVLTVDQSVDNVTVSPSSATLTAVGDTVRFAAVAVDANGNEVPDVIFEWMSGDTLVATVDADGLALARAAGEAAITAIGSQLPGQAGLIVDPEADQLKFHTDPGLVTAGVAIDPPVRVAVADRFGNRVEDARPSVTLSFGANPGGGTLSGALTVDAVDGMATFDDVRIERAAAGYTLRADVDGMNGVVSESFEVLPGPASDLVFLTHPTEIEGLEPFDPAVEVELEDEFGNRATTSSAEVTLRLSVDPTGGARLYSDGSPVNAASVNASDGVATFEDLSVDLPAEGYALEAESPGTPIRTSGGFDVHLTFTVISAGGSHSCGITAADHAYCWGGNTNGKLGDGTSVQRLIPVPVSGGHAFAAISAGGLHTCGVTTAGDAYCWGDNGTGALGDQTTMHRSTPVAVSGGLTFSTISAGFDHTCGVTTGGDPYCWGDNEFGELGDATKIERHSPVAVGVNANFAMVTAGGVHSCGLTTGGNAFCWGANLLGRLGDGTTDPSDTPVFVTGGHAFATLDAGNSHTCALTIDDVAYCWGVNSLGQLGDATTTNRSEPTAVAGGQSFEAISGGTNHTCAVTTAGGSFCWGANGNGQLGDGTTQNSDIPVSMGFSMATLSAGGLHSCGVGDVALCWGEGERGQLGYGGMQDHHQPVPVKQ